MRMHGVPELVTSAIKLHKNSHHIQTRGQELISKVEAPAE